MVKDRCNLHVNDQGIVASIAAVMTAVAAFSNSSTGLFHVTPGTIKAMRRHMDESAGSRVTQSGWSVWC